MDSGDGLGLTEEQRALRARLEELREEHRALDDVIAAMHDGADLDTLQLARLKKRKLALKDQMAWLEDRLTPDIIA
ncbi:MAG: YdcH family protein [Hyphomonadaceae bacterium]